MEENNEIWVFLSHSNKDYEKVCKIRNILEENGFRPLMFFLNCLKEDEEIDSLIKREIDCRKRFIFCESENSKKSKWVQREIEYIKSKDRVYEIINIDADVDKITTDVLNFKCKSSICLCRIPQILEINKNLKEELKKWDFFVYTISWDNIMDMVDKSYILIPITKSFSQTKFFANIVEFVDSLDEKTQEKIILYGISVSGYQTYHEYVNSRAKQYILYKTQREFFDQMDFYDPMNSEYASRIVDHLVFFDTRLKKDAYIHNRALVLFGEGERLFYDDRFDLYENMRKCAYCKIREAANLGSQKANEFLKTFGNSFDIDIEQTWNEYISKQSHGGWHNYVDENIEQ